MERTQAWELLCDPDYSSRLTMGEFHRLMVRAGYEREVADRAAKKRGWERLEAGVQM